MTTGTDLVANERSGKDILDENLWPGFDKFKVVQVRFARRARHPERRAVAHPLARDASPRNARASPSRTRHEARLRGFFSFHSPRRTNNLSNRGHSGNVRGNFHETDKPTFRAQTLLDRNKALIYEINKNHEARVAGGMERNVDLLRELNSNVAKAQELYEEAGGGFEFRQAEEGLDEAERRA